MTQNATTGTYTYTRRRDTTFTFDSTGRLSSITDRNNNAVALSWTPDTLTVSMPGGRCF